MANKSRLRQTQVAKIVLAKAIDLEILGQYRGECIIMETRKGIYGGRLSSIGEEFVHIVNCREYDWNLEAAIKNPEEHFTEIPNRTIRRSEIEEIIYPREPKE